MVARNKSMWEVAKRNILSVRLPCVQGVNMTLVTDKPQKTRSPHISEIYGGSAVQNN